MSYWRTCGNRWRRAPSTSPSAIQTFSTEYATPWNSLPHFIRNFPHLTYDVTIKIEHLRKYEQHLTTLRDTGCLFVISAVESVDDKILQRLDKGHTREDFLHVARTFRSLSMTLHPTFVAFTPWTTMDGYLDLLRVLAAEELVENVAPIQLGNSPADSRRLAPAGVRGSAPWSRRL